jgi:hypothetical protein
MSLAVAVNSFRHLARRNQFLLSIVSYSLDDFFVAENIEFVLLYLDEERAAEVIASFNIHLIPEKDFYKINQLVMKVGFAL